MSVRRYGVLLTAGAAAALLSVLLLQRRLQPAQWLSLLLLFAGIAWVNMSSAVERVQAVDQQPALGCAADVPNGACTGMARCRCISTVNAHTNCMRSHIGSPVLEWAASPELRLMSHARAPPCKIHAAYLTGRAVQ